MIQLKFQPKKSFEPFPECPLHFTHQTHLPHPLFKRKLAHPDLWHFLTHVTILEFHSGKELKINLKTTSLTPCFQSYYPPQVPLIAAADLARHSSAQAYLFRWRDPREDLGTPGWCHSGSTETWFVCFFHCLSMRWSTTSPLWNSRMVMWIRKCLQAWQTWAWTWWRDILHRQFWVQREQSEVTPAELQSRLCSDLSPTVLWLDWHVLPSSGRWLITAAWPKPLSHLVIWIVYGQHYSL